MRTPEQIAEDMRREIDRERQLHGTMYNEGSAVLGAVARAIARECARAKLEAVEPNPGAELRSDGARHSDCTNCGGQSATGGVFTPCEACGSTGDRVVQLEREAAALRALPMQNTFEPICRNCVNTGVGVMGDQCNCKGAR